MIKVINLLLSILKFFLLCISFVMTFYIMMAMYERLGKDVMDAIDLFIPYILLLVLFSLNYILGQKQVTDCVFYNLTCCLVFAVFIFAAYRTISDPYMLLRKKSSYNMSFDYFSDMIAPLKSMFYLLIVGNFCFMFSKTKENKG